MSSTAGSYRFSGGGTSGEVQGSRTVRAAGDGNGVGAVFSYRIELEPKPVLRLLGPLR